MYNPLGCFFEFFYIADDLRGGSPLNRNKSPRFPLPCFAALSHVSHLPYHSALLYWRGLCSTTFRAVKGLCRSPSYLGSKLSRFGFMREYPALYDYTSISTVSYRPRGSFFYINLSLTGFKEHIRAKTAYSLMIFQL